MTEAVTTEPIVQEVRIDAAPETVFGFFTEPEKLTRWLCESATVDPRPGGQIHQVHLGEDGDRAGRRYNMRGEFTEVSHPSRVVFSWGWDEPELHTPPGTSTVEVTFEADGPGTLLRLVHRDLPEQDRADHDRGWAGLLERLAAVAPAG